MAILKDESGLKVEIKFDSYDYECVQYRFFFALADTSAFNPAFAPDGFFFASEITEDSLIPAFEQALSENKFICWSPDDEPKVSLEIKPQEKNFELTFIIDATYLEGALRPAGGGLAFRIDVYRKELESFVKELKEEYEQFKKVNKIQ